MTSDNISLFSYIYMSFYLGKSQINIAVIFCRKLLSFFSSFDKSVFLWDVANTTIIRRFRGHAGRVNCVKLNEEGSLAVSGSVDGTARIWDLRSRSYEPIQERVNTVFLINRLQ